ncbi:MAG: PfkB family carbohydrate kinase [bacterium]|nr:PfkB family carbohydrate kinase [bacterium]
MAKKKVEKIVGFGELVAIARRFKKNNKKVVYAHGTFDLLHAGHIYHLEEARRLGDVLLVTVTPDRFIEKGFERPRFNEVERARFVAGLECVGYVSFTDAADAKNAICEIQPNIYVKGEDVRQKADEPESGLSQEIRVLKEVGGEVKFLKSLPIHSTALLNEFFGIYPKNVQEFLKTFREKYNFEKISKILKEVRKLKVLVIGDAIIDAYQFVEVMGKSEKSNNLTSRCLDEELYAGGVFACANHIAGFCDNITLVTCLGDRESYEEFVGQNLGKNVNPVFFRRPDAPTTLKRRFVEPAYNTKLFEAHHFDDSDLPEEITGQIKKYLLEKIDDYDVVLATDYGHGLLGYDLVDLICRRAKFVATNVQTNSANRGFNLATKYWRADYVCVDEPEIRLATHSRAGDLRTLIREVGRITKSHRIAITCGHKGCIVFNGEEFGEIPVLSTKVVDTVGAGDAFFSVSAPFAALNVPMELVGFAGNLAGALKVGTLGNKVPVSQKKFEEFASRLLTGR